jgi:hypothetical protein
MYSKPRWSFNEGGKVSGCWVVVHFENKFKYNLRCSRKRQRRSSCICLLLMAIVNNRVITQRIARL